MLVGIDIGGTFTDIVFLDGEKKEMRYLKTPSTPGELEKGVVCGLRRLREDMGLHFEKLRRIVHGSTVATNALLEGRWARTALVTTAGFRDTIEIGRQNRPDIYDLFATRPLPIVSRDLRFEVPERLDCRGEIIKPLDEGVVEVIGAQLRRKKVESVAVVLFFSYANPAHEKRIAEILKRKLDVPITLSSEILPEFREYERTSTTVINAALRPIIGNYLDRLENEASNLGFNKPWQIMQSNAGITSSRGAEAQPVKIVLSGPAAGVEGARFAGEQAGFPNLITLDMGGTSCDVSLIRNGKATTTTDGKIANYPIRLPMVDIHTIGAGGGSIAWIDKGGALRVGPHSAGANPGPVCYGKGGQEPTLTDAHLVLGRLDSKNPLGGLAELDLESARNAIKERIAKPLGMDFEGAAQGILAVADASMERAIRVISVERGHDPRQFVLLAFGGAGPLHGAALAAKLRIPKVLIPETAGVLSALGLLQTDLVHDYVQSIVKATGDLDIPAIDAIFALLKNKGKKELQKEGVDEAMVRYQPSLDMRYLGQSYELNLSFSDQPLTQEKLKRLAEEFHARHQQIYGHAAPDEPVELVNLRLRVVGLTEKIALSRQRKESLPEARRPTRAIHFAEAGWVKGQVFARDLLPVGVLLDGPAIVEGRESTVVIPPCVYASIDGYGNLIMEIKEA